MTSVKSQPRAADFLGLFRVALVSIPALLIVFMQPGPDKRALLWVVLVAAGVLSALYLWMRHFLKSSNWLDSRYGLLAILLPDIAMVSVIGVVFWRTGSIQGQYSYALIAAAILGFLEGYWKWKRLGPKSIGARTGERSSR